MKTNRLVIFLVLLYPVIVHGQAKWSSGGSIIVGGSQSRSIVETDSYYPNYYHMHINSKGKSTNDISPYIGYHTAPFFIVGQVLAIGLDVSYTSYSVSSFEYSIVNDGEKIFFTAELNEPIEYQVLSMKPKMSLILGDEESFIEFGYGYGVTYLHSDDQELRSKKVTGKRISWDGTETPYTTPLNDQHEGGSGLFPGETLFINMKWHILYLSVTFARVEYDDAQREDQFGHYTEKQVIDETFIKLGLEIYTF